jgi:hypothetical protein
MPSSLLNRLQRILYFADKVTAEGVYHEAEILEKAIRRLFEVMQKVAEFSCDYVRRGRFGRQLVIISRLGNADGRREDSGWASPPARNRRNGQRIERGH